MRPVYIHDGVVLTAAVAPRPTSALAPFTADDVAFCEELRADHVRLESPNVRIWIDVLSALDAHAAGDPEAATRIAKEIASVAISGSPFRDARCRTLMAHMLAVIPTDTGAYA